MKSHFTSRLTYGLDETKWL